MHAGYIVLNAGLPHSISRCGSHGYKKICVEALGLRLHAGNVPHKAFLLGLYHIVPGLHYLPFQWRVHQVEVHVIQTKPVFATSSARACTAYMKYYTEYMQFYSYYMYYIALFSQLNKKRTL